MSYTVAYTPEAKTGLSRLDVLLQEEVIDAIDLIADHPNLAARRSAGGSIVYDFVRRVGETRYYLFITVEIDHVVRHIDVTSIGHFAKPII